MSRKRKSQKPQSAFSKFVAVCVVIFSIGYYCYHHFPAFKARVDGIYASFLEKVSPYDNERTSYNPDNTSSSHQTEHNGESATSASIPASPVSSFTVKASNGFINLDSFLEKPLCAGLNHEKDHQLRDYTHYSICYRESYEQAEWSAYCLTEEELVKNAGRSDDFRPDPQITTGSATLADYKASGYDRGHLSPAADFAFDKTAMSETFYMSNMSPQAGSFNRGIWKDLESQVREWAKKFGRVYVISGPVLEKSASEYETIGANKVSIPQYYYKVLLAPLYKDQTDKETPADAEKITAIGFILPNKKCTDSFYNYVISIDEIEKRTGLDFFAALEDGVENTAEANTDATLWK